MSEISKSEFEQRLQNFNLEFPKGVVILPRNFFDVQTKGQLSNFGFEFDLSKEIKAQEIQVSRYAPIHVDFAEADIFTIAEFLMVIANSIHLQVIIEIISNWFYDYIKADTNQINKKDIHVKNEIITDLSFGKMVKFHCEYRKEKMKRDK